MARLLAPPRPSSLLLTSPHLPPCSSPTLPPLSSPLLPPCSSLAARGSPSSILYTFERSQDQPSDLANPNPNPYLRSNPALTLTVTPSPTLLLTLTLTQTRTSTAAAEIWRLREGADAAERALAEAEEAAAALKEAEGERDKFKGIARELRRQKEDAKAAREVMEGRVTDLERRLSGSTEAATEGVGVIRAPNSSASEPAVEITPSSSPSSMTSSP